MNNTSLLIAGLILLSGVTLKSQDNSATGTREKELIIYSSPGLFRIAGVWTAEYMKFNPAAKARVTLERENFTGIEITEAPVGDAAWKMIIGHDAVVAVINSNNPLLEKIKSKGVARAGFIRMLSPDKPGWNGLLEIFAKDLPFSIYLADNPSVKESLARFAGISATSLGGKSLPAAEVISAVQKDKSAAGFVRFSDIYGNEQDEMPADISLLPVDKNSNRRLDHFENIYENPSAFLRGVLVGKYPRELSGSIYITSKQKPADQASVAFLTWLISDGGTLLNRGGISPLAEGERKAALTALLETEVYAGTNERRASGMLLMVIAGLLTATLAFIVFKIISGRKPAVDESETNFTEVFGENYVSAPAGLYYDKTHTWAFMERDGLVRIGLDDFLPHLTGEVTGVKMKETGRKVMKGEKIFTIIHEGKQLEVHSPVSGTIKSINTSLEIDPSLVNSSPYYDGWIYLIEPRNWLRETEFLLMTERYREWLKSEFNRLKDFFATVVTLNSPAYEHTVLQDGGLIADSVLADLKPEVWEDFQRSFLDTAR